MQLPDVTRMMVGMGGGTVGGGAGVGGGVGGGVGAGPQLLGQRPSTGSSYSVQQSIA